jgi:hypothetical protein
MRNFDAGELTNELFGTTASESTKKIIEEFLKLRDLNTARKTANMIRSLRSSRQADHRPNTPEYYRLEGENNGFNIVIREIDPRARLLKKHDWDELIFGGFYCMECTPEDADDPDQNVYWPCPPLRAVGVTDEEAKEIIKTYRERIEAERAREKEKAGENE